MAHFTYKFGAMASTKTRDLLAVDFNFRVDNGLDSFVIKPVVDNRDGFDVIKSRDGGERKVDLVIYSDTNIFSIVEERLPDIVLVDEVNFLSKRHIIQLCKIKDNLDIPIIAYGIKSDFQNEMFEGSKYAFIYADKFVQMKTICKLCNNTATMNMRIINGIPTFKGEQIQLGSNESYLSVCSKCYDICQDKVNKGEF